MDLWAFYERVEAVILVLRSGGEEAQADLVETAIRGGATGWEVLGRLSDALPRIVSRNSATQAEIEVLSAWVIDQVRSDPRI